MHSLSLRYNAFAGISGSFSIKDIRIFALLAAIGVYAFFGSPTPDYPGLPEIITGFFLVIAVGFSGLRQSIDGVAGAKAVFWHDSGKMLLFYGLSVPLLISVMRGHDETLILRDLIPFLFFLLPLFLYSVIKEKPGCAPAIAVAIILLGLVFSMRALAAAFPFNLLEIYFLPPQGELFYFANAPSVLFAALILTGLAGEKIMNARSVRLLIVPLVFLFAALLPFAAMAISVQRATLGAAVLYLATLMLIALWKKPGKAVRVFAAAALIIGAAFPDLYEIWSILGRKNALVGLNMRAQEAFAVWSAVSETPLTLLFGLGWGGSFHSPAVGNLSVNFTHSLLTSALLKTGLVGFGLTLLYLAGLTGWLLRIVFQKPVIGFALLMPIIIDVFLYASFKSLDFGLVLLLIPASVLYLRGDSRKRRYL